MKNEPVIEANIPMPPISRKGRIAGGPCLYPVEKLGIGESFCVHKSKRSSLQGTAYRIAKKTGRKFTVRVVEGPDGTPTDDVRIWRAS